MVALKRALPATGTGTDKRLSAGIGGSIVSIVRRLAVSLTRGVTSRTARASHTCEPATPRGASWPLRRQTVIFCMPHIGAWHPRTTRSGGRLCSGRRVSPDGVLQEGRRGAARRGAGHGTASLPWIRPPRMVPLEARAATCKALRSL
eukprot:366073-Chlamydomonas_euryale.AAC.7